MTAYDIVHVHHTLGCNRPKVGWNDASDTSLLGR